MVVNKKKFHLLKIRKASLRKYIFLEENFEVWGLNCTRSLHNILLAVLLNKVWTNILDIANGKQESSIMSRFWIFLYWSIRRVSLCQASKYSFPIIKKGSVSWNIRNFFRCFCFPKYKKSLLLRKHKKFFSWFLFPEI